MTRLSTQIEPFQTKASYCVPVSRTTTIISSDAGSEAMVIKLQLFIELALIVLVALQLVPFQILNTGSGPLVHDTAIASPERLSYATATPL